MLELLVTRIMGVEGITGCIVVNPQNGSVLHQEGNINPSLEDITAFFGSGFDVVASSLAVKGLKYSYLEKNSQKFIILVQEGGYIGCEIAPSALFESVIGKIVGIEEAKEEKKAEEKAVGEEEEMTQEVRFLTSKVRQINLLIDEFSEGADRAPWLTIVREKFSVNDMGQKILTGLSFDNNELSFNGILEPDVREEDVSSVSKLVTDSLCRKAVGKFGAIEAKKKVHNVIEKLGIAR